ncbi:MAG: Asp-tRNA(Asn)/Glu-tRNA(Gln) amidotransferase subunit GatC [Firmicutes bacterium]|nr:Asp-tRNA(Asn)/Glu-tRNA(Gln) amidotransferase subunit GatC [Bacillota bacterium]
MAITREIIEYIAGLARLQLDEKDKEEMVIEISKIIAYFDKLKEMDTSNIDAMEYLSMDEDMDGNVLRDDVITESYDRKDLLCGAEEEELGYFIVPRVVE